MHDHRIGGCKGVLTITREGISFASERDKDSFDMKLSEFSFDLGSDQLTIRSGSKNFRFKSATARTKEENRSQLMIISQNISKLKTVPAANKK